MRIDSLSAQPDRAGRYRVIFSDGSVLRLYRQTVEDFALYTGMELTQAQLDALRTEAGKMSAKMRAVRIVAASSISSADLQERLVRKGEDKTQAREAVAWMEELHLVDDSTTARQLVQRCARQGYGLARAKQVLYEKRIPRQLWQEALEDYPDQTESITAFLRSRLGQHWEQKDLKRAIDALQRRGHSYTQIRQGLKALEMDTEDFPEEP